MTFKWILLGKVGTLRGRLATAVWKWCQPRETPSLSKIDALDLTIKDDGKGLSSVPYWLPEDLPESALVKDEPEYAVTGTPRHIPWSRRKKELEAGARQKRRQLESFREEA